MLTQTALAAEEQGDPSTTIALRAGQVSQHTEWADTRLGAEPPVAPALRVDPASNPACRFPAPGSRTRSCVRPRKACRSRDKASEAQVIPQALIREAHVLPGPYLVLAAQPPRFTSADVRALNPDWRTRSVICRGRDVSGHWADIPQPTGEWILDLRAS